MSDVFILVIQYTIIYATILAIVAIGGMFSERSGIVNLGLEGIMVIGALCGTIVSSFLSNSGKSPFIIVSLGILSAIIGGMLFSSLLALACVTFKADQTITGTAINILSTALAVIIARIYNKTPSSEIKYDRFSYIFGENGKIQINIFTILLILILIISAVYLYKTKYGMRLMACGEHPQAADSVGINVYKQRYIGVLISGVLAGIGGLAYVIPSNNYWDFKNGVAGFGFLALAVMIFGEWNPIKILFASLLFGLFQTIAIVYPGALGIPVVIYKMLPYIISVVVLAFSSKHSKSPKAAGIPYDKGAR